jgi:hypothetical protein
MSLIPLPKVIKRLEAYYGKPGPPHANDPWEMILWENIAYLADDHHRQQAITALREQIGTSPEQILATPPTRMFVAVGECRELTETPLPFHLTEPCGNKARTDSSVSASSAILSVRRRRIRGKRTAIPDLCRLD